MAGGPDFDVIIVLGAAQADDGSPGPVITRRVTLAAELFHQGAAGSVLLSGGATRHKEPEAIAMARVARDLDVPATALHLEMKSVRTFENALFCREIVHEKGWRRGILVTDDFHMRRAHETFRAFGMKLEPAPVRLPLTVKTAAGYCREFFARLMYRRMVRAYLTGRTR